MFQLTPFFKGRDAVSFRPMTKLNLQLRHSYASPSFKPGANQTILQLGHVVVGTDMRLFIVNNS